nr:hypothetical protein [Tanacetum cinerariifolium]
MKRSGFNLQQKRSKKQKLDEQIKEEVKAQADTDQEVDEKKLYMRIVPDEEIAIDDITLSTKPPVIVKYKIVKEGKISIYHIIRADGTIKRYTSMIKLLENIDREDLETLLKLVKDKHGNTRPKEDYDRVLYGDIKVMFEPDIERNMSYLTDYEEIDGGYVAFRWNPKGGKITGKGKLNGKADEGFFVGYSLNSKTFRVFNSRTRIIEENLHIRFNESTPNVVGSRPDWLFDIDALTRTMNNEPIVSRTQSNGFADNELPFDPNMPALKDVSIFNFSNDNEDDGIVADMNNLDTTIQVSPIPTTRIHRDHPLDQMIRELQLATQKKRCQIIWRNIGYIQEEGIDYDEVPVARIKAIRIFLAYASFKDFLVYQMDIKSAFLYGNTKEEVYVCQPPRFEDSDFPDRVYKVEKALYRQHQAPRAWYETLSTYMLDKKFQRGKINKTLFIKRHKGLKVKQKKDGIFISQDKYVAKILKRFGFIKVKNASTPMETQKPMLKDEDGEEVNVHMYRSMIGSLMYLTSSRHTSCLQCMPVLDSKSVQSARNRQWFQIPQHKLNMWLLQVVVDKCFGFKNNYLIMGIINTVIIVKIVMACVFLDEAQLHAHVDDKHIIITKASIRRDLQLSNEEGVDCLLNSTIFEQLALMGYEKVLQKLTFYKPFFSPQWNFLIHIVLQCLSPKTTAWNEFSSTIASTIICLPTNQKFNFSKWIFDSMIRNMDNVSGIFLMYPRFVQVLLDKHVDGLSNHERKYMSPSHTQNIFRNMRWVGKGFSERVTTLFPTMVEQSELGEGSTMHTDPHHTPTILQSSSSQPKNTHKPRKPIRKVTQVPQPSNLIEHVADEAVYKELGDCLVGATTTASSLEAERDSTNINNTQSKATPNQPSFQRTDSGGGPRCQENMGDTTAQTRVESSRDEESLGEDASKQGRRIDAIGQDEDITLVIVQDNAEMFDVNVLGGLVIQEPGESTKATISSQQSYDKGKRIMIEEPVKPKKKDQIRLNEEATKRLQAKFNEEDRLARNKAQKEQEANIALIET